MTDQGNIGRLAADSIGTQIQEFVPDPAKSQVNASMTGTITFKKGSGGTVDITGWTAIRIDPTAGGTMYFNSDTTKTWPIYSGMQNIVMVKHLAAGEIVNFVLGAATASVQGM